MKPIKGWLIEGGNSRRLALALLIGLHIVLSCVSLVYVAQNRGGFHIFYDPARLYGAVAVIAVFAAVGYLFIVAEFSFGYFVGFYFYTMILGFLWLNQFSDFEYNHRLVGLSAAAAAIAFLVPALFIRAPLPQRYTMSATAFDRLLTVILLQAVITVAVGASYNFRFVALQNIYDYRDKIESPTLLSYLVGMNYSTLLPIAFAGFVIRKAYWQAGVVLVLLLLFYPITLTKVALFTPLWLVAVLLLSKLVQARLVVILSLLLPVLIGVLSIGLSRAHAETYFTLVNFRTIAVPSNAMDIYNDFFSRHDLTYFCQVSVLKAIIPCPYGDPLSIVMAKTYDLGNFNASLFATEGIASVGPLFAPVSALVCGLVIALGNRLSAGLSAQFMLISSAILPLMFLNVPLTTMFLTHGVGILFLLWYLTPRSVFEKAAVEPAAAGD